MKDKRIQLESLKVRSFVTKIKKSENIAIKGGIQTINGCPATDDDITTVDTNGGNCIQLEFTLDAYCVEN